MVQLLRKDFMEKFSHTVDIWQSTKAEETFLGWLC